MDRHRSGFEEFAIAATPALLRSAFLLTGDQQLAEDLVQDALARTHRSWKRLQHEDNAAAYTRRTMYNLQVSWWRRRKVKEKFSTEVPEQAVADSSSDVDLKLSLQHALSALTPKQRAVVVLRFFEDRSVAETAELLRCSEGTVKTLCFRALAKLRDRLPSLTELTSGG